MQDAMDAEKVVHAGCWMEWNCLMQDAGQCDTGCWMQWYWSSE